MLKDFDTYDFSVPAAAVQAEDPGVGAVRMDRAEFNCCLVGSHGTGKTHIAIALGQAACRAGLRVRFFTAAELVSQLEKEQKQYTLDRFLAPLERAHLLICDELGYVTLEPRWRRAAVPRLRRPLRARQHAGDEQPAVQRMEPDLPGRADDRGAVGPL